MYGPLQQVPVCWHQCLYIAADIWDKVSATTLVADTLTSSNTVEHSLTRLSPYIAVIKPNRILICRRHFADDHNLLLYSQILLTIYMSACTGIHYFTVLQGVLRRYDVTDVHRVYITYHKFPRERNVLFLLNIAYIYVTFTFPRQLFIAPILCNKLF